MGEDFFRKKITAQYPFFASACIVYAIFFIVCLYKNGSGITFPVWAAGTCFFAVLMMKKADMDVRKGSIFYIAAICLLGVSTCLTGDRRIICMNKWLIFFLMIMLLLINFYDVSKWNPAKFIANMFCTVFFSLGCMPRPFSDRVIYRRDTASEGTKEKKHIAKYIFIGLGICVPIVAVILVLLANADEIFAEQIRKIIEDISFWGIVGDLTKISIIGFNIFMVAYIWFSWLGKREYSEAKERKGGWEPIIGITVTAALSLVYIIFCWIQVRYLFVGGVSKASLPEGVIYSTYARTGFFQLLFVSVINIGLVMVGIYCFRENKALKGLLCLITACTYIMIASSAMRMLMYIQGKYLTFLRIFVLFSLLVIALVLAGVIVNIFKKDFKLFKYSFAVITVCYVLFSFSRPDYWIAKVNTDNMTVEGQYEFFKDTPVFDDSMYLAKNLGTDAAPILLTRDCLPYKEAQRYYDSMEKTVEKLNARRLNLSWYLAWYYME
ncbi:MAG: DUF4173 domain-containing protein [Butyrivibrio sp.]|nr:DUF4173 domain-containing protein [Butyrivibrio sp.]